MIIYTDAGTKNNGKFGFQETRIVICDSGGKVIHEEVIGDFTSNEGEVKAMIWAMKNLFPPKNEKEKLKIRSDSQLAVYWAIGKFKTGIDRLVPLVKQVRLLTIQTDTKLEWIPREFNLAGHYIEEKYGL